MADKTPIEQESLEMTYVKIEDNLFDNPKILQISGGAIALWLWGLTYCSRNLTDGKIPTAALKTISRTNVRYVQKAAKELLDVGLWLLAGSSQAAQSLSIPLAGSSNLLECGSILVHDYLEYQCSKALVEQKREQKRIAGSRGGVASGTSRRGEKSKQTRSSCLGFASSEMKPDTDTDTDNKKNSTQQDSRQKSKSERPKLSSSVPPVALCQNPTPAWQPGSPCTTFGEFAQAYEQSMGIPNGAALCSRLQAKIEELLPIIPDEYRYAIRQAEARGKTSAEYVLAIIYHRRKDASTGWSSSAPPAHEESDEYPYKYLGDNDELAS
jgi:hypothetical protein